MKKRTRMGKLALVGILHFTFCIFNSVADLSATVTPGYVFGSGERPTTATLNLLANPTILITGTIGGTNAALTPGTITGVELSDSVVDNVTIQFDGSAPRALEVLTAGLAGPGLLGGTAGGPLTNNVDGVTIGITNDVVTLKTNLPLNYLACPSNYVVIGTGNGYATNVPLASLATNLLQTVTVSASVAATALSSPGSAINTAHGLGTTPGSLRTLLVCTTAEAGYVPGDIIDASSLPAEVSLVGYVPFSRAWCNSTNFGVVTGRPWSEVVVWNKTNAAAAYPTAANWTLRIQARP